MFGLIKIPGIFRAVSPIYHGGNEKTGAVALMNRIKFIIEDEPLDIPVINGNAIRGVLRRMAFADFLNRVNYALDVSKKSGQRLYHAFFSGGALETVDESSSGVIDLKFKKKVVENIPPARLFGFSYGNQIIESKLKIGFALPICRELKDYLPNSVSSTVSFYDLLSQVFQTRRDELRVEREEDEHAVQMLVEYEVYSPGTRFYHEIRIEDPDPIDKACLSHIISLWIEKPYIGGKSSVGLGEIEINYDTAGLGDGTPYLNFLEEKKAEIVATLTELEGVT